MFLLVSYLGQYSMGNNLSTKVNHSLNIWLNWMLKQSGPRLFLVGGGTFSAYFYFTGDYRFY